MEAQTYATEIVKRLVNAGYIAYFAGGWVRDFIMGHPSDDIDIATNAPPEKILDLFPNTILVGLAFGVIIVVIDGHQFEVATFRRDVDYVGGRRPTQIELATPEEDASRRDFTINGMFYDPLEGIVHDFVQGIEDIKLGVIRTIGNPYDRFFEDRLRMVRGVRFAARFGFAIDEETHQAIRANAETLFPAVAMERIWQELIKMSKYPHFDAAIIEMHRLDLLPVIFPSLKGVHLTEIRKRVAHFKDLPENVEAVLILMELFPDIVHAQVEEICRYLKMSIAEQRHAEFLIELRRLVAFDQYTNHWDKVAWTYAYSHTHFKSCLKVIASRFSPNERLHFFSQHEQRQTELKEHIQRIIQKKPLVNAALLQAQGIVPGQLMGQLIKMAEKIAILEDLNEPMQVLRVLKTQELWPKDKE